MNPVVSQLHLCFLWLQPQRYLQWTKHVNGRDIQPPPKKNRHIFIWRHPRRFGESTFIWAIQRRPWIKVKKPIMDRFCLKVMFGVCNKCRCAVACSARTLWICLLSLRFKATIILTYSVILFFSLFTEQLSFHLLGSAVFRFSSRDVTKIKYDCHENEGNLNARW